MSSSALLETLAATMHENYRREAVAKGWPIKPEVDKPYAELSSDYQKANQDAASRIPQVLGSLDVKVVAASEAGDEALSATALADLIDANIEKLSIAEHEGWTQQRADAGWTYAAKRDDSQKQHPSMVPYDDLSEADKEKDRNQVRSYPALLEQAGLKATLS